MKKQQFNLSKKPLLDDDYTAYLVDVRKIDGMKYYEALGLECIKVIKPTLMTCE